MNTLTDLRSLLNKADSRRQLIESDLVKAGRDLEQAEARHAARKEALAFFTKCANAAQEKVSGIIATVVTSALHIVHGPEYEFQVKFVIRRNSTEADLVLMKKGHEVDPLGNSGLGVANIIAISLRAAFIVMEGKRERILLLDEPTAALRVGKQHLAGKMLQGLCSKLGFQILLPTHSVELAECADKVYFVDMNKDGISSARLVENRDEIRSLMEG